MPEPTVSVDRVLALFAGESPRVLDAAADFVTLLAGDPAGVTISNRALCARYGRIGGKNAQTWIWDIIRRKLLGAGAISVAVPRSPRIGRPTKWALAESS